MNAVGADQDVAAHAAAVTAVAVEEMGGDAALVLRERTEPVTGMDAAFTEPRPHRLKDRALQPATMNRELRHVIAGIEAARLTPDLLTEPVGVDQLKGADADRVEAIQQPELLQLLDGMRQRVDADAELADRVGLLVDFAVDAAGVEHQGHGQPADAAANNDDLHGRYPLRNRMSRPYNVPAGHNFKQ